MEVTKKMSEGSDKRSVLRPTLNSKSIRLRLLTLLNVISTRPSREEELSETTGNYQRDWISIAKQLRATTDKQLQLQQPINSNSENDTIITAQKDSVRTDDEADEVEDEEAIDVYDHQFGPETELLKTELPIDQLRDEANWRIVSRARSKDHCQRSITLRPNHRSTISGMRNPGVIPSNLRDTFKRLNSNQNSVLKSIENYQDVWHTNLAYDEHRNDPRVATSLWILQHLHKTRNRVIKNNEYLSRTREKEGENTSKAVDPSSREATSTAPRLTEERDTRDQGFTRPKVMLLLPFRSTALEWVNTLVSSNASSTKNLDRFRTLFSLPSGTIDRLESDDAESKYTLEHRMIFKGNVDDDFKLGIKINRKEFKLYSELYQSDLIVASPVGLRKLIEKEGNGDFLSSIEVVVVDQMDVMIMQNWDHVEFVFDQLNQIPKIPRDTDFSRVKPWYLDGLSSFLRQTILFSSTVSPEQNSLFRKSLKNLSGKSIIFNRVNDPSSRFGILSKVRQGIEQSFMKFEYDSDDLKSEEDRRLEFFKEKVLKDLQRSASVRAGYGGIMIYVPNYFDFLRLENYFDSLEDVKYASISEYSSNSEITAARSSFFNRHASFLLITERFHYYNRFKIRGAKKMIFYGLPINRDFYLEFVDQYPFIEKRNEVFGDKDDNENISEKNKKEQEKRRRLEEEIKEDQLRVEEFKVIGLFSDLDRYRLEKIVGVCNYDDDNVDDKVITVDRDEKDERSKKRRRGRNYLLEMVGKRSKNGDRLPEGDKNNLKFVFV
ncbi:hypothetical protein PPACK8108_LOCUS16291 [Phakopsora pachyrhizi]|uniref:U3 small nucleolar RNA-associated protein 25 n=1 Tax=Phakopsora pachyrhizi TaxID=170000 RepID=A0AAV0BBI6_PHAPC|nr:hypothetical protein PPACK8108_LOCUS16291 [Phakopsora pachyrhizi]